MSAETMVLATGRRKNAVARVRVIPGTGTIRVNNREFQDYFPRETVRMVALESLDIRTTTLGVSLRGCMGTDVRQVADRVYTTLMRAGTPLLPAACAIEAR